MRTITTLTLALATGCAPPAIDDSGAHDTDAAIPSIDGKWAILPPFYVYDQLGSYTLQSPATPAWPLVTLDVGDDSIVLGIEYDTDAGGRSWAMAGDWPNDCAEVSGRIRCTMLGDVVKFSDRDGGWGGDSRTMFYAGSVHTVVLVSER